MCCYSKWIFMNGCFILCSICLQYDSFLSVCAVYSFKPTRFAAYEVLILQM